MSIPAFVRNYGFSQGSSSSTTVSLGITATAGDVGVIRVNWNTTGSAPNSVVDTGGNLWTAVPNTLQQNASLADASQQLFVAPIFFGGSLTVTATWASAASFPTLLGAEFSGVNLSAPIHRSTGQIGNSVPQTPSLITTNPKCVLFAAISVNNSSMTAGSGWTQISNGAGDDAFYFQEYLITPNMGSYTGTQVGGGSQQFNSSIVALAGIPNLTQKERIERFGSALFTGREYAYDITLERLL